MPSYRHVAGSYRIVANDRFAVDESLAKFHDNHGLAILGATHVDVQRANVGILRGSCECSQ